MSKLQYKNYLLILLTVVATFNYLDRYVLSLAMESIKQEFQLSDSQLGFLTGFAFASFYAVAGIPLARWADRGNRNIIITLTTGLWSAMVALCGLATSFTQLLLIRIGVAVGEAGCLPPANSLIADYFNRAELPKAMATYWLCGPIAVVIGYLGGGWLIDAVGWHMTFIIIGVPGVLLALLVKFTLKEPRLKQARSANNHQPTFKEVLVVFWRQPSLRYIVTAFAVSYFFGMGFAQWLPTFFIRSYGMETSEIGAWFALSWGGLGVLGTYLGGVLTNRYAVCRESLQMRWVAYAFVASGLCYVLLFLSSNHYLAIGFMTVAGVINAMCNGPIFSAIQSLVPESMRAVSLALVFLIANLIGMGLGPLGVGALSDGLTIFFREESLRYALMAFTPGLSLVGFFYWRASKSIETDIQLTAQQACSVPATQEETTMGSDSTMEASI